MQKTNFPFVCLVMDDYSTDGEQEVIKAWMERECDMDRAEYEDIEFSSIILVPHKNNKLCFFSFYLLKKNLYKSQNIKNKLLAPWREHSIYEALCEGDDYWTDPMKLQLQHDMLESNPEYSLCHCGCQRLEEGRILDRGVVIPRVQDLKSIIKHNYVATAAMFFRIPKVPLIPQNYPFKYPVYQHFLNVRLAEYGDVVYIDRPMSVYRIGNTGIYSQKPLYKQYDMAMGNIENMLDWFTEGSPNPVAVDLLKKRVITDSYAFLKQAVRKLEPRTFAHIVKKTIVLYCK